MNDWEISLIDMNRSNGLRIFIAILALLAAMWSGYLAYGSYSSGTVAGCGAGSGCAEVLASQWSRWLGVPVSLGAVAVYGSMVILLSLGRTWAGSVWCLWTLAITTLGSALWFIVLQQFIIHTTCVHCMMVHTLGSLISVVLLLTLPMQGTKRNSTAVVAGLALVMALVMGQWFGPSPAQHRVAQWGGVADYDTGIQVDRKREVSVLAGRVVIRPDEHPMLGSPKARHILVMMTDYTCIHCKAVHDFLQHLMSAHPDKLGVVLLPVPLDGRCNSQFPMDDGKFKDACALAELALVVWLADPAKFKTMDDWLFMQQGKLTLEDAHAFAATLIGTSSLEAANLNPWPKDQIQRNVTFYQKAQIGRLPALIYGPNMILGRPGTYEEFVQSLRDDLQLNLD